MRHSRVATLLLLPALLFGLIAPSAATEGEHTSSHKAEHSRPHDTGRTDFYGMYFPAGMPGTDTQCPGKWANPAFCIVEKGSWTPLPNGRLRIRDMTVYELAFAFREAEDGDEQVEPRKTGYDLVVANANLDNTLSGPTWGTWKLHSFAGELMFTGRFVGRFKYGIPAVFFIGRGVDVYEGQRMRGFVRREMNSDGFNMSGRIVEPRSEHDD